MPIKMPIWLSNKPHEVPLPLYSVVLPVYNEEDNITDLIEELVPVMDAVGDGYEIICVDDGSNDRTWEFIESVQIKYPSIIIPVRFKKNAGQSAAFYAGFHKAQGKWIITMDSDRQNDPRDIPRMLDSLKDNDVVLGYRENRQDNFIRRVSSKVANSVRRFFTSDSARDTGCSLKIFPREFALSIPPYRGMHRFYATFIQWTDMRISEVPVNHRSRQAGISKYNISNRLFCTLTDLFAVLWMRNRKIEYIIREDHSNEA